MQRFLPPPLCRPSPAALLQQNNQSTETFPPPGGQPPRLNKTTLTKQGALVSKVVEERPHLAERRPSVKSVNQCVHIYIVHSSHFLSSYFLAAPKRCGRVSARRGGVGKTIVTCHQLEPKWRRVGEGHRYMKQSMVQTRSPTAENKNTSQVTYLICFYLTLYVFYMMLYSFYMILHVFT